MRGLTFTLLGIGIAALVMMQEMWWAGALLLSTVVGFLAAFLVEMYEEMKRWRGQDPNFVGIWAALVVVGALFFYAGWWIVGHEWTLSGGKILTGFSLLAGFAMSWYASAEYFYNRLTTGK